MKTTRRMRAASLLAVAALGLSGCGAVEDIIGGSDETTQNEDDGSNQEQDGGGDSDDSDDSDDNGDGSDENDGDDSSDDSDRDDGGDNHDDSDDGDGGDSDDNGDDSDRDDGGDSDDNSDDSDRDDGGDSDDNSDDSDSDDGGSTSLTSPGTELKVGDTATIPQGDEGGTVTVTVSKITRGSFSDLSHLKDADKYKDYTPVYVEYEFTGGQNADTLEYRMPDNFRPILTDGRRAGSLVIFGSESFTKCDANTFPKGFSEGDTMTDCDIAMLASGQELGGAEFREYDGDYTDNGKIVWKQ